MNPPELVSRYHCFAEFICVNRQKRAICYRNLTVKYDFTFLERYGRVADGQKSAPKGGSQLIGRGLRRSRAYAAKNGETRRELNR
jgi:hypothetical protein